MLKKIVIIALVSTLAAGCASVPMESLERTTTTKEFDPPSEGSSGLYVYRKTSFGAHLKGDVWVDGKCLGATAPSVFFYKEIEGDKSLNISPISDFRENASETYLSHRIKTRGPLLGLNIQVKSGMNYFIQQNMNYLGDGVPSFKLVDEEQGKEEVSKLDMAAKVGCGRMHSNKPSFAKTNIPAIEKLDQDYHGDMQKKVQQSPISSDQKTAWYTAIQKLEAGNQFQTNGAYDKAIENFQQALTLFRKIGAEEWIATSLGNIGNVYNSRGQYDKAIENYQQALTIARKLGSENMVSKSLMNIEKAKKNIILKEAKE